MKSLFLVSGNVMYSGPIKGNVTMYMSDFAILSVGNSILIGSSSSSSPPSSSAFAGSVLEAWPSGCTVAGLLCCRFFSVPSESVITRRRRFLLLTVHIGW